MPDRRRPIRVPAVQALNEWNVSLMRPDLMARYHLLMLPIFATCTVGVYATHTVWTALFPHVVSWCQIRSTFLVRLTVQF